MNKSVNLCRIFPLLNSACQLSLTCHLAKGNVRPKKLPGQAKEKDQSYIHAARASGKRQVWEQEEERAAKVAGKCPTDDTYFYELYEREKLSLEECISRHKDFATPEMLNNMEGAVFAHFTINMRTKKKTKFTQKLSGYLLLPHKLDFIPPKKILAFCKDPEQIAAAMKTGALDAGGVELVNKVEHGQYHWESYDNAVCHRDILPQVLPVRHVLKERLPTPKSGRVGEDITALVNLFTNGMEIEAKKTEGIPEIGTISLPLGRLSWNLEHLRENLSAYAAEILNVAPSRTTGSVIEKIDIHCPPSDEVFTLDLGWVNPLKTPVDSTKKVVADEDTDDLEAVV